MPYLNWKEAQLALEVDQDRAAHPRFETRIRVSASGGELDTLASRLEEIFEEGKVHAELRVDLPQNWILFFKQRESESRVLVAHPNTDEWVTTAALEAPHGHKLIEGIRGLGSKPAGTELSVNGLAPVGNVSNVELVLRHA